MQANPVSRHFLPPLGPTTERITTLVVLSILGLLWIYVVFRTKTYDWLLISGWASLVLGIALIRSIPDRLDQTLERLADRAVLAAGNEQLDDFRREVEEKVAHYWAPWGGVVVATAIAVAFLWAFTFEQLLSRMLLLSAEVTGGYLAGCYLGRLSCYGTLGVMLKVRNMKLHVIPGHLDGVAGWKPVGDFFFYQAMVVGIPAAFLAVWLLLIPLPQFHMRYHHWQEPYLALLVAAVCFEVLAFILPLWTFHREMLQQKRAFLRNADHLSHRIAEIQQQIVQTESEDHLVGLKTKLADMTAYARTLEELPVWPVSNRTKRIFGLNNLGLVIPLLAQYSGLSKEWADFLRGVSAAAGG
jgi:hypothetical protein